MDEKMMQHIAEDSHKLVSSFEQRIRADEREKCNKIYLKILGHITKTMKKTDIKKALDAVNNAKPN